MDNRKDARRNIEAPELARIVHRLLKCGWDQENEKGEYRVILGYLRSLHIRISRAKIRAVVHEIEQGVWDHVIEKRVIVHQMPRNRLAELSLLCALTGPLRVSSSVPYDTHGETAPVTHFARLADRIAAEERSW